MSATTPSAIPQPPWYPPAKWFACKKDYVHGIHATIPACARAHGIHPPSAQTRAKNEKWSVLRTRHFDHLNQTLSNPQPEPTPAQSQPIPNQAAPTGNQDVVVLDLHIERVNKLLELETDPLNIDRLASALTKLSERRRILLGIPNPGSLRPSRKPQRPAHLSGLTMIELPSVAQGQPSMDGAPGSSAG